MCDVHCVTGALGYAGRHIASLLLAQGCSVRSLTARRALDDPLGAKIDLRSLDLDDLDRTAADLSGTSVLYNTYWVRFARGRVDHALAVARSARLFEAARRAGVQRVVHVSITNPSLDARLSYFRGKAEVEQALARSGLSHAILRPAVFFGGRDILLNNIAWLLRRSPLFFVAGDGRYRVQPIHVDDLARLAVAQGARRDHCVVDAVGPETYTYRELVQAIASAVGSRARLVHVPKAVLWGAAKLLSLPLRDVLLTHDEITGLMRDLLVSASPPTGGTSLATWLRDNADRIGVGYASELARHYARPASGPAVEVHA